MLSCLTLVIILNVMPNADYISLLNLDMDQYGAPKQHTPSIGLHYIFNVDGEPIKRMGSKTCITHNGIKYSMDVKFKNRS